MKAIPKPWLQELTKEESKVATGSELRLKILVSNIPPKTFTFPSTTDIM